MLFHSMTFAERKKKEEKGSENKEKQEKRFKGNKTLVYVYN